MPRTEIRYLNIKKEYYAERRDEIMERNKKRHEENKERYYISKYQDKKTGK